MRNKRKPAAGDGIPIVTYSRLPSDLETPDDAAHEIRDAEPWLDGVEVPLVERKAKARGRVAPDIRADTDDGRRAGHGGAPVAAAPDLFAEPKRRRPGLLTYVAVVALVALVAGLGVLVLTFRAATTLTADAPVAAKDPQAEIADLQKQIDALANSAGPASEETRSKIAELEARLADIEAAKQPAAAASAPVVRTISTDGAPAAVPAPRERPADLEAHAAPAAEQKPAAVMELVSPTKSVTKSPFDRIEAKPVVPDGPGKAVAPGGDADFIANIEKALADAPPDPAPPAAAEPPAAAASASGGLTPADEEPASLAPVAAPSADAIPNDIGPTIRFVPRNGGPSDPAAAEPLVIAPQAAAPAAATPDGADPGAFTLDQPPAGLFDIPPEPGAPVPPESIPNVQ